MDRKGERCITNIQCKQYEWIIKNLSSYSFGTLTSGEFIRSGYNLYNYHKKEKTKGNLKWTIKLDLTSNQPIKIYLILSNFEALYNNSIRIKCEIKIFKGDVEFKGVLSHAFTQDNLTAGPVAGITFKQEECQNCDFKIICSIFESFESTENDPSLFIPPHIISEFAVVKPNDHVINNFKRLLKDEELSDLILKSKSKSFKVHKAVLGIQSPYFMAALKNNTKEKQESVIELPEDDDIVEEILNYMYTGEVDDIVDIEKDLLIAADKYQLEGLKKICTLELIEFVDIDNAVEYFLFAEKHNAKDFENHLIKFISTNYNKISKTNSFNLLSQAKTNLAQVFECLI